MTTIWKAGVVAFLFVGIPALMHLALVKTTEAFLPKAVVPSPVHEAQATTKEGWKPKHAALIERLVECESGGKSVKIVDANGYYSYGILQYQSSTWNAWSSVSGIKGDPMVKSDAVRMADWAIERGYLHHWTCASLLGLVRK